MDPSLLCKTFFCFGTAVDLGGTLIPSFREQIMNYGSRGIRQSEPAANQSAKPWSLFEYVASIQVSHTWFTHYYVVSVALSIFWAFQFYTHGFALKFLASYTQPKDSMTTNQVFLAWLFMMVQGTRRLYESLTLTKPSESKMWIGLWLIGIAYYVFMGVSVWIEGIATLSHNGLSSLEVGLPSIKTSIAASVFVSASIVQHECHKHLASLKKYSLPRQYWFQRVICPHYTSECAVYLAIALLAAPPGQLFNKTVLAGLGFVASNLGVTADSTRKWYVTKFGAEKLDGKWRMIPYLY
ncbi:related to DFG10 protein [Rhynchosporium agropyri]|uniref:Polyprenal reductase n=1 Tax=Rhynchosporium agropyri TaxID=914238 RepID=A0A1E1KPD6_9HELO|nr:related to DFG10 protein [Rhynchosporium agropyri]